MPQVCSAVHDSWHCTRGSDQDDPQEKRRRNEIPKKKKGKKAKWLSEEALQIAEKRREVKGKGEEDRYNHWNAEF